MPEKKINIKDFFERGFDQSDFINANDLELPKELIFMAKDEIESRYGTTNRYIFKDPNAETDGQQINLLCKGSTFKKAIEQFVNIGERIILKKNDRNYWVFDLKK